VTDSRLDDRIRLVLLDIEGTTTPIAFVHDVLFPFAHMQMARWCEVHGASEVYTQVRRALGAEHDEGIQRGEAVPAWRADTPDHDRDSMIAFARWLMDRDRKSPGLKYLQGLIWEDGYQSGVLRGEVFADVPMAMRRWRADGLLVAIYSSGSVLAQRRLFESTAAGDLTPLIAAFFDTMAGGKKESSSYARIAGAVGLAPSCILFISDVTGELEAAERAGCAVRLSVRPGNPPQPDAARYLAVHEFDGVLSRA
jgi:enolase-phosphatase E1